MQDRSPGELDKTLIEMNMLGKEGSVNTRHMGEYIKVALLFVFTRE